MTINLFASEVLATAGNVDFNALPLRQKRWIAARIMENRGTARAKEIAYLLTVNNPNLNNFAVLRK